MPFLELMELLIVTFNDTIMYSSFGYILGKRPFVVASSVHRLVPGLLCDVAVAITIPVVLTTGASPDCVQYLEFTLISHLKVYLIRVKSPMKHMLVYM